MEIREVLKRVQDRAVSTWAAANCRAQPWPWPGTSCLRTLRSFPPWLWWCPNSPVLEAFAVQQPGRLLLKSSNNFKLWIFSHPPMWELFLALFLPDFSGSFFLFFWRSFILKQSQDNSNYTVGCPLSWLWFKDFASFPSAGRKKVRKIYNVSLLQERNIQKEKRLFPVVPYFSQIVYNHIFVLYYHYLIKHSSIPVPKTDNLFQYPIFTPKPWYWQQWTVQCGPGYLKAQSCWVHLSKGIICSIPSLEAPTRSCLLLKRGGWKGHLVLLLHQ